MAQSQQRGGRPSSPAPQPGPQAPTTQADTAAQDLKEQVQETADQATEQMKHTAQSLLGSQKGRATQSLNTLADTLHQTGEYLRQSEGGGFFATYADRAATGVQQFSGHLDEREVSELIADLERYARKQPVVFLGGAFALGTLVTRFLRSSGQRESGDMGGGRHAPVFPDRRAARFGTAQPETSLPPQSPATSPGGGTRQPGAAPTDSPVAKQGAAPTARIARPSGGGSPRQPATPAATPAPGTTYRADVRQGAAPPQPAPLLPPDLDPRPGQRDPNKPRQ